MTCTSCWILIKFVLSRPILISLP